MNLADRYRNLEDPLRTERRVELVLIVVVLLLALQVLWGGFRALLPSVPEPVPPRPGSLQVKQLETGVQVDPELRAEIVARPVFWASRRPPETSAEAAAVARTESGASAQESGKMEGVKLKGVFGGGENAGIIVIAEDKKRRVMVGEEINGWELLSVNPVEAVFGSGGRDTTLALKRGNIQASQVEPAVESSSPGKPGEGDKKPEKAQTGGTVAPVEDRGTLTLGGRPRKNKL